MNRRSSIGMIIAIEYTNTQASLLRHQLKSHWTNHNSEYCSIFECHDEQSKSNWNHASALLVSTCTTPSGRKHSTMKLNAAWQKASGQPRSTRGQRVNTQNDSTPTSVQCIMLRNKE